MRAALTDHMSTTYADPHWYVAAAHFRDSRRQPERAVEDVEVEHVVEDCPLAEEVVRSPLLEGDRVRGEPVVADVLQVPAGPVRVGDAESSTGEAGHELVRRQRRLSVGWDPTGPR